MTTYHLLADDNRSNLVVFFFNDTATTEIYTSSHTLSLHDALPISPECGFDGSPSRCWRSPGWERSEEHTSELQSRELMSYAVFCLKKKNTMLEFRSVTLLRMPYYCVKDNVIV